MTDMTPEERIDLKNYLEAQFTMYTSKGWKDFIEKVEDLQEVTDKVTQIKDAQDLFTKQGELKILNWILSWSSLNKMSWDQNDLDEQ